jgi:hypothetical protein
MKKITFICLLFPGLLVLAPALPGDVFKEPSPNAQMVQGMEKVQWPGIMIKARTRNKPDFKATVEDYEGRPHFRIETSKLTYYYDIRGGGFSRIIDENGNDWISFKMEPWGEYPAAAAGAFRGLPNMVFQEEDDGAGHPGHNKCDSWLEDKKIVTRSLSGKWKWSWEFFDDHAVLEVLTADPDRTYWFLYEGTPGGKFDPENTYFGTSNSGPEILGFNYYTGDVYRDKFQWTYVGHNQVNKTFYMIHCNDDDFPDMVSMLGNSDKGLKSRDGMTVFAFGRGKEVTRYLQGRQKFIIGMYPEKIENLSQHKELAQFIELNFLKN